MKHYKDVTCIQAMEEIVTFQKNKDACLKECWHLLKDYHHGEWQPVLHWFETPNSGLGNIRPVDLLEAGSGHLVLEYIKETFM